MAEHRYEELLPRELAERVAEAPIAWVPWGALEWHSHHLPLGLDGLKAHALCRLIAERAGGVVLPPTYLPVATLQHPWSISFAPETVQALWLDLFGELERVGFRLICVLSGHYAPAHLLLLAESAEQAMAIPGRRALVVALRDVELVRTAVRNPADHAAKWETSLMQALRPDLVHLDRLDPAPLRDRFAMPESYRVFGIMGRDPRTEASAEAGRQVVDEVIEAWVRLAEYLLSTEDRDAVLALYRRQREEFARHRDTLESAYVTTGSVPGGDWQHAWDDLMAEQLGNEAAHRPEWFKSRWRGSADRG